MDVREAALHEAIEKAGGQKQLADLLELKPPSITGWILRKQVPSGRVLEVEFVTGVSKHRLRPDIYPPPPKTA